MKREEAVALLKEIVGACRTVYLNHISLKTPREKAAVESGGFELHIRDHLDEEDWKCLKDIIQKRSHSQHYFWE